MTPAGCRLMYWVDGDEEIQVANLDGTQRRQFLRVNDSRFDGMVIDVRRDRFSIIKLLFHDADSETDTDSDSPDTSIHPYVRFSREDPREDVRVGVSVGVGVRVGVVEYQL